MFTIVKIQFYLNKTKYKDHILYKNYTPFHYSLYPIFSLYIDIDNIEYCEMEIEPVGETEDEVIYELSSASNKFPNCKLNKVSWRITHITNTLECEGEDSYPKSFNKDKLFRGLFTIFLV